MGTTQLPWDWVAFQGTRGLHVAISVPNQPELCGCGAGAAHSNAFLRLLKITTCSVSSQQNMSLKAGREMPKSRADTEQVTRAVPATLTREGFG